jgi:hypothetical protein
MFLYLVELILLVETSQLLKVVIDGNHIKTHVLHRVHTVRQPFRKGPAMTAVRIEENQCNRLTPGNIVGVEDGAAVQLHDIERREA